MKPNKNSKKGGAKGSVAFLESTQLGCVPQDSSLFFVNQEMVVETRRQILKDTWHQIKIRERKGSSRGIIHKCHPHERRSETKRAIVFSCIPL